MADKSWQAKWRCNKRSKSTFKMQTVCVRVRVRFMRQVLLPSVVKEAPSIELRLIFRLWPQMQWVYSVPSTKDVVKWSVLCPAPENTRLPPPCTIFTRARMDLLLSYLDFTSKCPQCPTLTASKRDYVDAGLLFHRQLSSHRWNKLQCQMFGRITFIRFTTSDLHR